MLFRNQNSTVIDLFQVRQNHKIRNKNSMVTMSLRNTTSMMTMLQVDQRNEIDPNAALELVESAATWLSNRFHIVPDPPTIVF